MQTQVMPERTSATAWLEFESRAGRPPERVPVLKSPFVIGRGVSADYQVKSSRVSREHAVVVRQGETYTIRDLGSTNGTLVNGERVDETPLTDGDLIALGDIRFTFIAVDSVARDAATQVIDGVAPARRKDDGGAFGRSLITAVRQLQEAVVLRSERLLFQPIASIAALETVGVTVYPATLPPQIATGTAVADPQRLVRTAPSRLATQWRRMIRRWAIEEAAILPEHWLLFIPFDAHDIADDNLAFELEQLQRTAGGHRTLICQLSESVAGEGFDLGTFRHQLHDLGLRLALTDFAAGRAGVANFQQAPPDYVQLAATATRGAEDGGNRHRQMASSVRALRELHCEVIAAGLDTDAAARACQDWGCQLAQGDLFGPPASLHEVLHPLARRSSLCPKALVAAES